MARYVWGPWSGKRCLERKFLRGSKREAERESVIGFLLKSKATLNLSFSIWKWFKLKSKKPPVIMNMETARTISALFDKYSCLKEARPSRKASEGKGTDKRTLDCDFQPPNCLLFCDDNLWA